jgi:acetyltransferase-like isoleucine patch superfamily enzyme
LVRQIYLKATLMDRITSDKLKSLEILADPRRVRLLFEGNRATPTTIEPCVQMREGMFDIEHIGGYTYFGGRNELLRHIQSIGRFCSIAGGIIAGQVEHPTSLLSTSSCLYGNWRKEWPSMTPFYERNKAQVQAAIRETGRVLHPKSKKIVIGNDVWIGYGALISRGVTIGDGAIVAARTIVTRDVPPYAIVAGSPARVLRYRFPEDVIAQLQELRWWDYGTNALIDVDQADMRKGVAQIALNIKNGAALWRPDVALVSPSGAVHRATNPRSPVEQHRQVSEVLLNHAEVRDSQSSQKDGT